MRVLVTGGAGFIGSDVARQPATAGTEAVALSSLRGDVHTGEGCQCADGAEGVWAACTTETRSTWP